MRTQILFKRLALVAVVVTACVACGQKGPLYLPNDPQAQDRASLPDTLLPHWPSGKTDAPRQPQDEH